MAQFKDLGTENGVTVWLEESSKLLTLLNVQAQTMSYVEPSQQPAPMKTTAVNYNSYHPSPFENHRYTFSINGQIRHIEIFNNGDIVWSNDKGPHRINGPAIITDGVGRIYDEGKWKKERFFQNGQEV